MAGTSQSYTKTFMSAMSLLRVSSGDTASASAAYDLIKDGTKPENRVPDVRVKPTQTYIHRDSLCTSGGFNHAGGIGMAMGGMFRAIALGGSPTKLSLYALFSPTGLVASDDPILTTPVLLAESTGPVLEYPNPPGDCIVTVLANAACRIYYSHTN